MSSYSQMRPFYRMAYNLVGLELAVRGIDVEGRENVPNGGCLFVANHASFYDPTTAAWAAGREMYYLARKSLFRPPVMNWLLPICNVLPIDRDGRDIAGLRRIIRMMQEGHMVLMFPEGTRSPDGTLQAAEPGAGLVALKAGVPILPARVFGTYEAFSRHDKFPKLHRFRVVIGQPYLPTIPTDRKTANAAVANEMMARIAALT